MKVGESSRADRAGGTGCRLPRLEVATGRAFICAASVLSSRSTGCPNSASMTRHIDGRGSVATSPDNHRSSCRSDNAKSWICMRAAREWSACKASSRVKRRRLISRCRTVICVRPMALLARNIAVSCSSSPCGRALDRSPITPWRRQHGDSSAVRRQRNDNWATCRRPPYLLHSRLNKPVIVDQSRASGESRGQWAKENREPYLDH
jgi:hypothetical protein